MDEFKSILLSGKARYKRLHILGFHLHEILDKENNSKKKQISKSRQRRLPTEWYKETIRVNWNVLHHDFSNGYTTIFIYQNTPGVPG